MVADMPNPNRRLWDLSFSIGMVPGRCSATDCLLRMWGASLATHKADDGEGAGSDPALWRRRILQDSGPPGYHL
jgi:hypothetical protein